MISQLLLILLSFSRTFHGDETLEEIILVDNGLIIKCELCPGGLVYPNGSENPIADSVAGKDYCPSVDLIAQTVHVRVGPRWQIFEFDTPDAFGRFWTEEKKSAIRAVALCAQLGNQQAIQELYKVLKPFMLKTVLSLQVNTEDAEDIVHTAFMSVLRRLPSIDVTNISAYATRAARNATFNLKRNRKRRTGLLQEDFERNQGSHRRNGNPINGAVRADPTDRILDEQRADAMDRLLAQLTHDHRQVLILRYRQDLTYAEVAEALGVKLGTVMSRLSRAHASLAKIIRERGSEETALRLT